jgi:putative Holliday junction resolvase
VLAFDFGLRQIGLAVGNCHTGTSQPLTTVKARDGVPDWQVIESLIDEWQPDCLVVGMPLNMDGSASELARLAGKFGRRLAERFQLMVEFEDERLSSFEAKQQLSALGHRGDYQSAPADSLAAKLILDTWLARNRNSGSG